MKKKTKKWKWKCLICHNDIKIFHDDNVLPNIEGGTIKIDCGYGSEFDLENMNGDYVCYQSAICDNCISKNKSYMRKIRISQTTEISVVDD